MDSSIRFNPGHVFRRSQSVAVFMGVIQSEVTASNGHFDAHPFPSPFQVTLSTPIFRKSGSIAIQHNRAVLILRIWTAAGRLSCRQEIRAFHSPLRSRCRFRFRSNTSVTSLPQAETCPSPIMCPNLKSCRARRKPFRYGLIIGERQRSGARRPGLRRSF